MFDDDRLERLHLAALLHDIGKMIVPRSVMNRATRMDKDMPALEARMELLKSYYEIDFLKGKITEEKVKDAIRVAQGESFVKKMDGEYDAHIARGGTNVSGGQKQRLAIARAIARDPEIYIFDDSFSALDYKTDKTLRTELKNNIVSATTFIVAQRIGTILDADKIVVLDQGEVVGIGPHEELLKNCSVYQEIAYSQLSKEELENA